MGQVSISECDKCGAESARYPSSGMIMTNALDGWLSVTIRTRAWFLCPDCAALVLAVLPDPAPQPDPLP